MRNPYKRFINISHRIFKLPCFSKRLFICFMDLVIKFFDIRIEEDGYYHFEGEELWDIVVGFEISVHACIGQEVDVCDEVVPFACPISEKFGNCSVFLFTKGNKYFLSLNLTINILRILFIIILKLDLNPKNLLILLIQKEIFKNNILILLYNPILTHNKRREKFKIFSSERSLCGNLFSLLKERLYQLFYFLSVYGRLDGLFVIL